jgi:hypothetical protein
MNHQPDALKAQNAENVNGAAALSICESMLIALNDLKIINDKDAHNVLLDAAATHRSAGPSSEDPGMHTAVADLIEKIMNGKNSVRRI